MDEALMKSVASQDAPFTLKIYYFSPPTAILGLHQTVNDVDLTYLQQNALILNRRLTGGGVILLGLPNAYAQMGITIVAQNNAGLPANLRGKYEYFTPVIENALKTIGMQPERDDHFNVVIGGKKIAGCGIYVEDNAFLYHIMILLDCDYDATARILKMPPNHSFENVLQNMQESVTTIFRELGRMVAYKEIEAALIDSLSTKVNESVEEGHYLETEISMADTLHKTKYCSGDWILGTSYNASNVGACFVPTPSLEGERKK